MWMLQNLKSGAVFYLLPGKTEYTIGRNSTDLILTNDSSISRTHAKIVLSEHKAKIVDLGSKFGTYYYDNNNGKVQIRENLPFELTDRQSIHIGKLSNKWQVCRMKFCTVVSTLSGDNEQLREWIETIGGSITNSWSSSCTHLTMPQITVTLKVLHALVENIPIVSPKYWEEVNVSVKNHEPLPNCRDFLPTLAENLLNKDNLSFDRDIRRKTLFANKTLIFLSRQHYETYCSIISSAGGTCRNLNSNNVKKSLLTHKDTIIIRYIPSSQSQNSENISKITDLIAGNGRRLVPECEIALAIVNCSLDKYCNPDYKVSEAFLARISNSCQVSQILAPESHDFVGDCHDVGNPSIVSIPETIDVNGLLRDSQSTITTPPCILDDSVNPSKRKLTEEFPSRTEKQYRPTKQAGNLSVIESVEVDSVLTKSKSKCTDMDTVSQVVEAENPRKRSISSTDPFTNCSVRSNARDTLNNAKRPRIADFQNSNDDDLFDFGKELNRNQNRTEIGTQLQIVEEHATLKNNENTCQKGASASYRKIEPLAFKADGWLSKSLKSENIDQSDSTMFLVMIKPMNLTTIPHNTVCASTINSMAGKQNFKPFMKKKCVPQTRIVTTAPFVATAVR